MRDSNIHPLPETIFFGQRTIGSTFPVEIPFKADNEERWRDGLQFHQDGFVFTFDDSASHDGWWASKPGVKGVCQVDIS